MYVDTTQVPPVYQWDESSRYPKPDPGSAPSNCGPTCVTFIANFYRDKIFGIYATRSLVVKDPYRGTSANEQRDMLIARGVAAYISQPDYTDMHRLVQSGRRPIIIGLWMKRVPPEYRDHDFEGMHAIVLRRSIVKNGVPGFEVLDPNFSTRTGRFDPDNGKKFYPNWVIASAFVDGVGSTRRGWAVIPSYEKPLPPPTELTEAQERMMLERMWVPSDVGRLFTVKGGTQLYKGPGTSYPKHFRPPNDIKYRLVAFDRDPNTGKQTGWVWGVNPSHNQGVFCVPPKH